MAATLVLATRNAKKRQEIEEAGHERHFGGVDAFGDCVVLLQELLFVAEKAILCAEKRVKALKAKADDAALVYCRPTWYEGLKEEAFERFPMEFAVNDYAVHVEYKSLYLLHRCPFVLPARSVLSPQSLRRQPRLQAPAYRRHKSAR